MMVYCFIYLISCIEISNNNPVIIVLKAGLIINVSLCFNCRRANHAHNVHTYIDKGERQ